MTLDIARGIRLGAILVVLLLFGLSVIDFIFALRRWESVGSRLQRWAGHYPLLAMGLVVVLAVLAGHFFGH
jgi:hypothetical protein